MAMIGSKDLEMDTVHDPSAGPPDIRWQCGSGLVMVIYPLPTGTDNVAAENY